MTRPLGSLNLKRHESAGQYRQFAFTLYNYDWKLLDITASRKGLSPSRYVAETIRGRLRGFRDDKYPIIAFQSLKNSLLLAGNRTKNVNDAKKYVFYLYKDEGDFLVTVANCMCVRTPNLIAGIVRDTLSKKTGEGQ